MKKIILISCVSKKLPHKARAEDLYISTLFKYSLRYGKSLHPDKIFILSAEHGLLDLNKVIEPYNKTLNTMPSGYIKKWSDEVIERMNKVTDLEKDKFVFLAGEKYYKYLLPHIRNYEEPLKGLSFGFRLKYLKNKVKNEQGM